MAHLIITWAADLATHGTEGNDREHIDLFYMVTDKGWRITRDSQDGEPVWAASREGQTEIIPCPPLTTTFYDAFADYIDGAPFPSTLADITSASRDVALIRQQAY